MPRSALAMTVAVVLVLLATAPTPAQQAGDPYSINNLVALRIIPRPTNADQARILNEIIAEQIAQTRRLAGGVPSTIGSSYVSAAQQQMTLFSIKWAYRERTDPGFYASAEYIHDKQLLAQGCFPTCPPDDGASSGRPGGNARAVLDQLRALQATDLSGVMSPRRIAAAAAQQEANQLKYEIPKVIDFTKPDGTLEQSDIPAIDFKSPDIFPRWDEVREADSTDKNQFPPCLTEDTCQTQAETAAGLRADSVLPADTPPDAGSDSAATSAPSSEESDPDLERAKQSVLGNVKDYYRSLQTAFIDGVREAKQVVRSAREAIVSDLRFGKLDVNPKYAGSLKEMIANEGEGGSRAPLKAMAGQFLVDLMTSRARNAIRQEAVPDNDPSALADFAIRTQIVPNGSLTLFRGSEVVEGADKVLDAAVLGVERGDGR